MNGPEDPCEWMIFDMHGNAIGAYRTSDEADAAYLAIPDDVRLDYCIIGPDDDEEQA